MSVRLSVLGLVALLAVSSIERASLLRRGFGEDELYTTTFFIESPSLWHAVSNAGSFNNHLGYSLAGRLSERIFGRTEWALRLPAFVFGLVSIVAVWIFARRLGGPSFALLAAVLYAFNPAPTEYGVSARGYSAMILLTLVSNDLYLRLINTPRGGMVAAFVASSVAAIYFHLYSSFTTMTQLLFRTPLARSRIADGRPGRSAFATVPLWWFSAIAGLAALCYLPAAHSFAAVARFRGRGSFDAEFPASVLAYLAGGEGRRLVAASLTALAALGFFDCRARCPRLADFLAAALLIPLITMWLIHPFDLYPRLFVYWAPYWVIFAALGLTRLDQSLTAGSWSYAARSVIVLVTAGVLYAWRGSLLRSIPDDGYREASQIALSGDGTNVGVCAIGADPEAWQFYFPAKLFVPRSLDALLEFRRRYSEVRCVDYDESWQRPESAQIAQYLSHHGERIRVKKRFVFVY